MAQSLTTNHLERDFSIREDDLGELLDRVCRSALWVAAEAPYAPRVLRVRAGEASIEVEWQVASPDGIGTPAVPVAPAGPPRADDEPAVPEQYLTAPMVGVFYCAPEPGAPPFVRVGDVVAVGQQIGIVEAMKLMVPVQADAGGRVLRVIKGNAEPVEYGEPLFALAHVDAG